MTGRPNPKRPSVVHLSPEIAFERLDDGGVLACQLETGDYWHLSAPAGPIWQWIREQDDFDAVVVRMREEMHLADDEARAGLAAFCDELRARGLLTGERPG